MPMSRPSSTPLLRCFPQRLRPAAWAWLLVALWLAALWQPMSAGSSANVWPALAACSPIACAQADSPPLPEQHCAQQSGPAADHAPDPTPATDMVDLAVDVLAHAPLLPARPLRQRLPLAARWRSCAPRRRLRPPRSA